MPEWDSPRAGDPAHIGRYRIVGRIADSGHGVVFLAETDGGVRRAVKVLHTRLATGSPGRERLLNEVGVASRVPLFGTARIFDVDFDDEYPYVVAEYVPGKSLQFIVSDEGPLGGAALHRLAIATLTALAALHRAEIVHRDVKPQNVVFGPDGPTIVDYGIAQALEDAGTQVRGAVGTPPYRAPEQLLGLPAGPAADMFAWAVTMTYAATGRPGFTDADPAGDRFRHGEPDIDGVPEPLRTMVARCLAKDPAERPTAREAWDALLSAEPKRPEESPAHPIEPAPDSTAEPAVAAEAVPAAAEPPATVPTPVTAPTPAIASVAEGGRRWTRGRRAYLIAAAAAIVVIGASAAVIIPRTTADRPSRTTHQPAPPAPPHLTVGSANFPENALLAEVYAQALEAKGFRVTRQFNLGNRETYFKQIAAGTISVIPEYNGALSSYVSGTGITDTGPTTTSKIDSLLHKTLPPTVKILHPAIAEDKDSVTVTRRTAGKYGLRSLTDLQDAAPELLMGGPPEFETRHQGLIGLLAKYRVNFKDFRAFRTDDQDAMVQLLKSGAIQAADIFTTDPAIKENKFVVLQDPQRLFSAQNVIPLVYRTAVDGTAEDALDDVSAALDTQDLLDMNTRVAHKENPATVAKDWLAQAGLGS